MLWLLIGEELAVGTVREQVTGPQVQGDLVGGHFDLAQAARELRGLGELEQLDEHADQMGPQREREGAPFT